MINSVSRKKHHRGRRGGKTLKKKQYVGNNLNINNSKIASSKSLMNMIESRCSFCKTKGIAIWWLEKFFLMTLGSDLWWKISQFLGIRKNCDMNNISIVQHIPYFGFTAFNNELMIYHGKMSKVDESGKITQYRRRYIFTCSTKCRVQYHEIAVMQLNINTIYHYYKKYCKLCNIKKASPCLRLVPPVPVHVKIYAGPYMMISDESIMVHPENYYSRELFGVNPDKSLRFMTRNDLFLRGKRMDIISIFTKLMDFKDAPLCNKSFITDSKRLQHWIYYNKNNILIPNTILSIDDSERYNSLNMEVPDSNTIRDIKKFTYRIKDD